MNNSSVYFKFGEEQTESDSRYGGHKRQSWAKAEEAFQKAQDGLEQAMKDGDKVAYQKYWDEMFFRIMSVSYNFVNRRLQLKKVVLPKDVIEERALDVCLSIVQTIKNKIDRGDPWRIGKLSSYCWYPSLKIFSKELQFVDRQLSLEAIQTCKDDEDREYELEPSAEEGEYKNGIWYSDTSVYESYEPEKKDEGEHINDWD